MLTRRKILTAGGGLAAAHCFDRPLWASELVEIQMQGRTDGSQVWFDPIGILIAPGQTVRWINRNPGNSHTTTAYSPDNFGHARRITEGGDILGFRLSPAKRSLLGHFRREWRL